MEKAWSTIRRIRLREREQKPGEEIANSVSHAVGAVVAVIAATFLLTKAAERDAPGALVGASVFAATMVFAYISSAIYHALRHPPAKRFFKVVDHSAILLLIAGTYTPFTLGVLRGTMGSLLLVLVWSLAIVGVVFIAASRVRYPTICTLLYLAMGWTFLVGVEPLYRNMSHWGLFWLGAGGLAYTGGIVFFAMDRLRFGHLVWHLCVLAGTACHYVAVYHFA